MFGPPQDFRGPFCSPKHPVWTNKVYINYTKPGTAPFWGFLNMPISINLHVQGATKHQRLLGWQNLHWNQALSFFYICIILSIHLLALWSFVPSFVLMFFFQCQMCQLLAIRMFENPGYSTQHLCTTKETSWSNKVHINYCRPGPLHYTELIWHFGGVQIWVDINLVISGGVFQSTQRFTAFLGGSQICQLLTISLFKLYQKKNDKWQVLFLFFFSPWYGSDVLIATEARHVGGPPITKTSNFKIPPRKLYHTTYTLFQ